VKTTINETPAYERPRDIEPYIISFSRYSGIAVFAVSLFGVGYILVETFG
jgi:hypothetical protein